MRAPIWESLGLSDTGKYWVIGGVAAAVVGLVAVIVITEPPALDETARPVGETVVSRPLAPRAQAPADAGATAEGDGVPAITAESRNDVRLQEQRATFEAAVARAPNDAEALNSLGLVLQQLGKPAEAAKRFEAAVAAQPRKVDYRMNLAAAFLELTQFDRAIDQYREIVLIDQRGYNAQYALAAALQRKGDHTAAVTEFEKARKLGPNAPGVPLGLAESYERLGRLSDAVKEYQVYLQLQPDAADAARVRTRVAALTGTRAQVQ